MKTTHHSEKISVDKSEVFWADKADPFSRVSARDKYCRLEGSYLALMAAAAMELTGLPLSPTYKKVMNEKYPGWWNWVDAEREQIHAACGKLVKFKRYHETRMKNAKVPK